MFSKEILNSTPHLPGVYMMIDGSSRTLYVGKAKDLFKRLSSYFRFNGSDHNKTTIMLSQAVKVNTIITRTEKEALILEASLIKKHKPKYNIILRDDKNYPYIKVTVNEDWPRVFMSRRQKRDGAKYFGPYSSSSSMWSTLKLIASIFPLRKCKGTTLKPRKRPCLNHQIGKCLAPCVQKVDKNIYLDHVENVIMILEGKNHQLVDGLKKNMQKAAEELHFEKAATIRDQINSITKTLEKQLVVAGHDKDQDIFGFHRQDAAVGVSIMFIRGGILSGSRNIFLEDPYGDDAIILSQIINQLYDNLSTVPPREILLPLKSDNMELLEEKLSDMRGSKVSLLAPKRGDKVKLIEMATQNSKNIFDERDKKSKSWEALSSSCERKLRLQRKPIQVECLDISNTSGKQAVGSLIAFSEGEPNKQNYRHYSIKTVEGPDDYAMMKEVLYRRLSKGIDTDNLPDLFIVDGGRGQLSMAMSVANELGISQDLDWLGIAKEKESEGEKLYKPGRKNPIILASHDPVLLFIMRVRDESHRFGVTFHRKLRSKATIKSSLDEVEGIGNDRRTKLLKHFGSVKKVEAANLKELTEVPGIGPNTAEKIFSFLQNK